MSAGRGWRRLERLAMHVGVESIQSSLTVDREDLPIPSVADKVGECEYAQQLT